YIIIKILKMGGHKDNSALLIKFPDPPVKVPKESGRPGDDLFHERVSRIGYRLVGVVSIPGPGFSGPIIIGLDKIPQPVLLVILEKIARSTRTHICPVAPDRIAQ